MDQAAVLAAADPGIRDVLKALWRAGLETTDSGDGVSKPDPGIVFRFEHVVVALPDLSRAWEAAVESLDAVGTVRPGQPWQVELTRSLTTTGHETTTCFLYRLPEE